MVTDLRDLGEHFDYSQKSKAATLNKRTDWVVTKAKEQGTQNITPGAAANVASLQKQQKAFYGCEITRPSEDRIAALDTAMAGFTCPTIQPCRNPTPLIDFVPTGVPFATGGAILFTCVVKLRRVAAADMRALGAMKDSIAQACNYSTPGTDMDAVIQGRAKCAPPPRHPQRRVWRQWGARIAGPADSLLIALAFAGVAVADDLIFYFTTSQPLSILEGPYQWFKRRLAELCLLAILEGIEIYGKDFQGGVFGRCRCKQGCCPIMVELPFHPRQYKRCTSGFQLFQVGQTRTFGFENLHR